MIYMGTLINAGLILFGSAIGLAMKAALPERLKQILFQSCGLITLYLGFKMALEMQNMLLVVFSLILGGILGESVHLEEKLEKIANRLKEKVGKQNHTFTEGFITATMLYCIGSMAIIGSLDSGLRNDHTILITKGILDGCMSIVFSSTFGIGAVFSIFPLFLYQGTITSLAFIGEKFFNDFVISQLTGTGGVLIIGLGLMLLNIKKIKVTNLSPSLLIVLILSYLYPFFMKG